MAKSYIHELGDRLSNGFTADNLPKHIKEIAPIMYNDGSNNFNSIQSALNGKAASNHTHGNIANGGTLTDTAAAASGNDYVVIRDADNAKIQTSTIKGTDVADAVSKKHSHSTLTLSTTAQAYDGSHTLALPSTDPYTSARTPTSHTHGNIANGGTLTDTAAAAAGNDYVVIRDADNAKIQTSTIKGTDVADAVSKKHSHSTLTLSTTAQAYDGTHTLALPSSDPYTSARTPSSHTHGNITNGGTITSDTTVASGDKIAIIDADNNKVARSGIAFDGSTTTTALTPKGTFETFSKLTIGTTSTTAAAGNHTHTTSIASDSSSGTVVTLAHNTQYKLTAGGNSVLFKTPADSNTDTKVTQTKDDSGTAAYPLLMAGAADPNGTAATARYDSGVKLTPSTNTISANISGNAATATSATKATQDSDGNAINATYFKSSGNVTLVSGTATKIGTQNGTDVKLTLPAIPAAANNGALQLQLNGGTASSKFTANQSGNSTLAFSTGSTAGTFKVDSTEIAIAGFTKVESSSTNGNIKINGTETAVYTHPTTAGNKHIPSGGSSGQFLGYDSAGTAKWVSNPNTDTKQRIVASDSKTYLTGVTTAPTSSNQDLTGVANANVYATAGQLHATTFDVNSKCTLQFNTTTNALDFVFA